MIHSGKSVSAALDLTKSMTILLHEIIKYVINKNIEDEIKEICHG